MEKFLAGGAAGAIAQFLIYPMEVIKTRLATASSGTYSGTIDCFKSIYYTEGKCALYRGLCPSMLGIIPYAGIDLACFETLKHTYEKYHEYDSGQPGVYVLLGCGALSSMMGQVVAYPIALIRTRMQADGIGGSPAKYKSATHAFTSTLRHEGVRSLYRGIGANLAKAVPAASISWTVYELCKQYIARIREV